MSVDVDLRLRLATTLSWPVGIAWTSWHYMWRILPVHRREEPGRAPEDLPPPIPEGIRREEIQEPADGVGPLLHRLYSCRIAGARIGPEELIETVAADPNRIAPRQIAKFTKAEGQEGRMRAGDEFLVHMPGPWNGPVRAVEVRPDGFRFATLAGHLEAGQIEWRAWQEGGELHFAVESWARGGDRVSAILHDRLGMAKEVQLYMWTSVLERAARLSHGRLVNGVSVRTRRIPPESLQRVAGAT
jgi:hypothetical protein